MSGDPPKSVPYQRAFLVYSFAYKAPFGKKDDRKSSCNHVIRFFHDINSFVSKFKCTIFYGSSIFSHHRIVPYGIFAFVISYDEL